MINGLGLMLLTKKRGTQSYTRVQCSHVNSLFMIYFVLIIIEFSVKSGD